MPDTTTATAPTPDLLASTGVNDPNSPWNLNGLLQTALATGVNAGQDALTNALGLQTSETAPTSGNGAPASTPSPNPANKGLSPSSAHWTFYVAMAAAIALVAWVLFGEKR